MGDAAVGLCVFFLGQCVAQAFWCGLVSFFFFLNRKVVVFFVVAFGETDGALFKGAAIEAVQRGGLHIADGGRAGGGEPEADAKPSHAKHGDAHHHCN